MIVHSKLKRQNLMAHKRTWVASFEATIDIRIRSIPMMNYMKIRT